MTEERYFLIMLQTLNPFDKTKQKNDTTFCDLHDKTVNRSSSGREKKLIGSRQLSLPEEARGVKAHHIYLSLEKKKSQGPPNAHMRLYNHAVLAGGPRRELWEGNTDSGVHNFLILL